MRPSADSVTSKPTAKCGLPVWKVKVYVSTYVPFRVESSPGLSIRGLSPREAGTLAIGASISRGVG